MADSLYVNNIKGNKQPELLKKYSSRPIEAEDVSIFDEKSMELREKLNAVDNNNGAIRKGWNDIKETVGVGTSTSKCNEAIEKYEKGEITYEEASQEIDKYAEKQDSSLNLFANIATAVAAIGAVAIAAAATVASGGTLAPVAAVAIGAATGAVTKTGFKLADRATNNVQGDDFDAKTMGKDFLSGAVTGGVAAATMGTASGASSVGKAAVGCAKTGVKTGAISGSSNYVIDCAFDENKDFNLGEFAGATATGAAVGGTVGFAMGGLNGTLHSTGALNSGCNLQTMTKAGGATFKNVAANSACTAEYKILNQEIRNAAAA